MCRVIRFVTAPARFAVGIALDLAFGKAEGTGYVSCTRNDLGEMPDGTPLTHGDFW